MRLGWVTPGGNGGNQKMKRSILETRRQAMSATVVTNR